MEVRGSYGNEEKEQVYQLLRGEDGCFWNGFGQVKEMKQRTRPAKGESERNRHN